MSLAPCPVESSQPLRRHRASLAEVGDGNGPAAPHEPGRPGWGPAAEGAAGRDPLVLNLDVVPVAAVEDVDPKPADQHVVTHPTQQDVGPGPADEDVVADAA